MFAAASSSVVSEVMATAFASTVASTLASTTSIIASLTHKSIIGILTLSLSLYLHLALSSTEVFRLSSLFGVCSAGSQPDAGDGMGVCSGDGMGEMAGGRSSSVRSMTGDTIITGNVGDGGGYGDKAGVRSLSGSDSGLGKDGLMWSTTRLAKRLTKNLK